MAAQAARSKVVHARLIQAQFEPYQRSLQTSIVGSSAVPKSRVKTGAHWILELADTILFPAGGGQPSDRGTLCAIVEGGERPVYDVVEVERQDDRVLHFVKARTDEGREQASWSSGAEVSVELDWQRRFDHMQQHSGQHLLSALAFQMFGWKTASWNLGEEVCYIDFDAPAEHPIQPNAIADLQNQANLVIRDNRAVDVRVDLLEAPAEQTTTTAKFGVRTVNIAGVDDHNRCCGTHVRSTADLQAIVFAPRSSDLKDSKVYFWAGDRVTSRLTESLLREQTITTLLTTGPASHVTAIDRLQKERRQLNNKIKHIEDELVPLLVDKLLSESSGPVYALVRPEDEAPTLHKIATALRQRNDRATVLLISALGPFVVAGPDDQITPELGRRIAELLQTRGGGKKGTFQGNVPVAAVKSAIAKLSEIRSLLLETYVGQQIAASSSSE